MITPEQLKARAQEHIEALSDALASGQTEPLVAHLRAQAHLRGYSAHNRTLIHLQHPEATHVLPASEWAALGRTLKPDARPLLIYSPRWKKTAREDLTSTQGAAQPDDTRPAYFVSTPVYDVSSTVGEPLRQEVARPFGGDEETLQALLGCVPFPVVWAADVKTAGFDGTAIRLPGEAATQGEDIVATVRVWAALELEPSQQGRDARHLQAEADCAAVLVCETLGVNALASAADQIAVWGGRPKKLKRSLGRIVDTAERLLAALVPVVRERAAQAA